MCDLKAMSESLDVLARKVGPKANVYLSITDGHVSATIYTKGLAAPREDITAFTVNVQGHEYGFDFQRIVQALEERWLAETEKRGFRIIEEMALEIIRLTAEFGSCTDAALRAKFGESVAKHSEAAVGRANEMASNGPFSVEVLRNSNAA